MQLAARCQPNRWKGPDAYQAAVGGTRPKRNLQAHSATISGTSDETSTGAHTSLTQVF